MSNSYTATETFTISNAKYLAAKVATDLARIRRLYGAPASEKIDKYEKEITELLAKDYLESITYGFKRNGKWVLALKYYALLGGQVGTDSDPGRIKPGIDTSDADFCSFLVRNDKWDSLSQEERDEFENRLPFKRGSGEESELENGVWTRSHQYLSGGRTIERSHITHY